MLPRAIRVEAGGEAVDTVTLAHDERHRRRVRLAGDGGLAFLLDLAAAQALKDGDRLVLEDGRRVRVRAAEEDVLEVTAADAAALARIAWHLGNRHAAVEVLDGGRLRLKADHVLEHLLCHHLAAEVIRVRAPFQPEGGAYGGHHGH